jgi:starch synthase
MKALKVLSVASEVFPLAKTGGLADVVGALPAALQPEGISMHVLMPGYPAVLATKAEKEKLWHYPNLFGGSASLLSFKLGTLSILTIDAPHLYAREGGIYGTAGGDWPDNAQRFAALGRVAADLAQGVLPALQPDVLHLHDWQSGLAAAYLRYDGEPHPPIVMTVHNIAFQGQYAPHLLGALGLPPRAYSVEGVEYFNSISFLKAGLQLADRITTVSPTYAQEIRTPEFGMGLDGLLRARSAVVSGILNGLDGEAWNPETDTRIAQSFGIKSLARREANKLALCKQFGLTEGDGPIFGIVSRLSWQKGLDLFLECAAEILARDGRIVILGSGDAALEKGYADLAAAHPGRVGCRIGYSEDISHLIHAGCDSLVVPSRFEPCGLTQLSALRYGAVPIVARTGGLADTIIDANPAALRAGVANGIQFSPVTSEALLGAIRHVFNLYAQQPLWKQIQKNGMAADVSWTAAARQYATLYRDLTA